MKRLLIIGASGHGKVVADVAKKNDYKDIAFLDDNERIQSCGKYPVLGNCESMNLYPQADYFVAIGDAVIREKIQIKLRQLGLNVVTLVHPHATIGENVTLGAGTIVMAGAVINPGTVIGEGCIINTCSSVDHDCQLENFIHVSVGSHIAGTCNVGNRTWVGVGAIVSNNITICSDSIIGAGAVVIKNIYKAGTYIGVPAKRQEKKQRTEQ